MNSIRYGFGLFRTVAQGALALTASFDEPSAQLTLRLSDVQSAGPVAPTLSTLTLDGVDARLMVRDAAESPELVDLASLDPAAQSGTDLVVAELAAPLETGVLYLVSYEIRAASGLSDVSFDSATGPFANQSLPTGLGVHHVLVTAADDTATDLLQITGTGIIGFVSCRRAEWRFEVPPATTGGELADTPFPGSLSGSGKKVASPTEALVPDDDYVLSYGITDAVEATRVFTPGSGAFSFQQLTRTVGVHHVTRTCQDTDTAPYLRSNNDVTFSFVSLKRAGTAAPRQIGWQVDGGGIRASGELTTPSL